MRRAIKAGVAALALLLSQQAQAQQQPDWDRIEIRTTNLGHDTYMLEGQGGNITVAIGSDGILMVDTQFAPLHDKIAAAIRALSPLPVRTIVNTHYHGDHVGGNAAFQKEGASVLAQDNIRVRLAAGTSNPVSGVKTPPAAAEALPKQTYVGGTITVEVGGRKASVTHATNAHTDGDSWVYLADANVLCTGDIVNNLKRYHFVDYANGGDIRGIVAAIDQWLKVANDSTKFVVGHGPLATKADILQYQAMAKTALERIRKLIDEGKSEAEVVALDPLADLNRTWAPTEQAGTNFVKQVYNSFSRS